jgi:hypothetical protein
MSSIVQKEKDTITADVFVLEPRNKEIMRRWFEVNFVDIQKTAENCKYNRGLYEKLTEDVGYINLELKTKYPFFVSFLLLKKTNNDLDLTCYIHLNKEQINEFNIVIGTKYTHYIDQIDKLKDSYKICKCGEMCWDDKIQCEECYIYNYEHPEDCAICMSNNYRWTKLKCGHIFHGHCIAKVDNKKCPMCRAKFDLNDSHTIKLYE